MNTLIYKPSMIFVGGVLQGKEVKHWLSLDLLHDFRKEVRGGLIGNRGDSRG